MKTRLIASALFGATTLCLSLYPALQVDALHGAAPANPPGTLQAGEKAAIEVVFVLDTTGSMGGMLETAKEKIWSIASSLASSPSAPQIKMGLVAYRDRGDNYVTRVIDLSQDLDTMYATLMDLQAAGGGDGPESVNQALHEALSRVSWSQGPDTYRTLFLVGDAPPHMDYPNDLKYPVIMADARRRGILVNTIQCGQDIATDRAWRKIAALGQGRYFQVDQSGGALAITTPFDERISKLSAELDATRLYYGSAQQKAKQQRKIDAARKLHSSSSTESQARRAAFNLTASGRDNFLGENELVDDLASGRVDLSAIPEENLPAPIQAMAPAARQEHIDETHRRRASLERELKEANNRRGSYIAGKVEALDGKEQDSLDHRIYETVREQAAAIGLEYEKDALQY